MNPRINGQPGENNIILIYTQHTAGYIQLNCYAESQSGVYISIQGALVANDGYIANDDILNTN